MNTESVGTAVQIMGKIYKIKCSQSEMNSLQRAVTYLEEKMRALSEGVNTVNIDRIAIITALNIVHQLLTFEQEKNHHLQNVNQRLRHLHDKVERALGPPTVQMELTSAD